MIFDSYGVFDPEINYGDVMPQGDPEVYGTALDVSY